VAEVITKGNNYHKTLKIRGVIKKFSA